MRLRLVAIAAIALVAVGGMLGMQLLEYLNTPRTPEAKERVSWQRENNYLYRHLRNTEGLPGTDELAHLMRSAQSGSRSASSKTILALGDSATYGTGTENPYTLWWETLQRKLDKQYGTGTWTVETYARPGASTTDYAHWAAKLAKKHQASLIIVAHNFNDHIPSPQTLDRLCEQGDCAPRLLETHPKWRECFNSADSVAQRMQGVAPNLSRNIEATKCTPEAVGAEVNLPSVTDYRNNPQDFPYLSNFTDAAATLVALETPVVAISMYATSNDKHFGEYYLNELKKAQILVLEPDGIDALIANGSSVTANPADEHPGSALQHAYAAAALDYIGLIDDGPAGGAELADAGSAAETPTARLTAIPELATVAAGSGTNLTYTPQEDNGQQHVPCARLGYAHLRLNFAQATTIALTAIKKPAQPLELYSITYDPGGVELAPKYLGALETTPTEINGDPHGTISILIADKTRNCGAQGTIDMPEVVLSVTTS